MISVRFHFTQLFSLKEVKDLFDLKKKIGRLSADGIGHGRPIGDECQEAEISGRPTAGRRQIPAVRGFRRHSRLFTDQFEKDASPIEETWTERYPLLFS